MGVLGQQSNMAQQGQGTYVVFFLVTLDLCMFRQLATQISRTLIFVDIGKIRYDLTGSFSEKETLSE